MTLCIKLFVFKINMLDKDHEVVLLSYLGVFTIDFVILETGLKCLIFDLLLLFKLLIEPE